MRYPPSDSQDLEAALIANRKYVEHHLIQANYGHDSFLVDVGQQTELVRGFLSSTFEKVQ